MHSKGFCSTVLARLVYASPTWSGFCSTSDINKLDRFINRYKYLSYCTQTTPCITEQFDKADESLFQTVTSDSHHVLNHRLPAIKHQRYKLKPRTYSFTLTCKSSFHDNCNLIIRTLFKDAYWLLWTLLCSLTVFIYTLVWYCSMWCVIVPLNHYDDDDVRRLRHQWGHLCHACQQHHYLLINVKNCSLYTS